MTPIDPVMPYDGIVFQRDRRQRLYPLRATRSFEQPSFDGEPMKPHVLPQQISIAAATWAAIADLAPSLDALEEAGWSVVEFATADEAIVFCGRSENEAAAV